MAHYALINNENLVVNVITGVDEFVSKHAPDGTLIGGSSEAWEQYYQSLPWFDGLYCKRTSYTHQIRKQFAGIGYSYDADADVFIAPQPFPSWSLDENYDWQPPTPMPDTGQWVWDETKQQWVTV